MRIGVRGIDCWLYGLLFSGRTVKCILEAVSHGLTFYHVLVFYPIFNKLSAIPKIPTVISSFYSIMVDRNSLPEGLRNPNNCQKEPIPGYNFAYGYQPSLAAGIIFCLLFGIAFFGHTLQAIRLRRATSVLLSIGALSMCSLSWNVE